MARKQVVEVHCSRCERVEYREGDAAKPPHVFLAKLFADLPGQADVEVKFEDLCTPCMRSVRTLLEQAAKRIEGVSPDRFGKEGTVTKPRKPEAKEPGVANGATPSLVQPAAATAKGARQPA